MAAELFLFLSVTHTLYHLMGSETVLFLCFRNCCQVLRHNNAQGSGGFEEIGTSAEGGDLVLEKLLSYDEMGKLIAPI